MVPKSALKLLKNALDKIANMKEKIVELVKYGIYGGITTIINLVLFYIFNELNMYYLLANAISYIIAVIINYILNKLYVFETNNNSMKQNFIEFIKFMFVRLGSLVIDSFLFYVVVDIMKINVYVGRIGLSIIIILLTYVVNRLFVFKKM